MQIRKYKTHDEIIMYNMCVDLIEYQLTIGQFMCSAALVMC